MKTSVLKNIYAIDIYANVYKINFDFEVGYSGGTWTLLTAAADQWSAKKVFSGNPPGVMAIQSMELTNLLKELITQPVRV